MAMTRTAPGIIEELSDLFASAPSRDQLLKYRPSKRLQQRARRLLAKQSDGQLTKAEEQELDEFLHAEALMGLVKATIRAPAG
jgi:hypothetical protein